MTETVLHRTDLMIPGRHTMVVAVDGSAASLEALRWAAAHRRVDQRLHAVTAWELPRDSAGRLGLPEVEDEAEQEARTTLAQALDQTFGENWSSVACADVVAGSPKEVFGKLAEQVEQIVVGSRGRNALVAGVLGSVSRNLVTHSDCVVTVVRPRPAHVPRPDAEESMVMKPGGVVVGIDDTPASRAALHWAVKHRRPGQPVYAVRVWHQPIEASVYPGYMGIDVDAEAAARTILEELLEEELGPNWRSSVTGLIVYGSVEQALRDLSVDADDLVIGSRHHNPMLVAAVGAVTTYLTQHCTCPVTVVRSGSPTD